MLSPVEYGCHAAPGQALLSAGQGAGEPQVRRHAGIEAGRAADLVAGEGEDEHPAVCQIPAWGSWTYAERGLTVGRVGMRRGLRPRRSPVLAKNLAAAYGLVFQQERRHGHSDILAEQCDDGGNVAGLVGAGKPLYDFPLFRRTRAWGRLPPLNPEPLAHRGTGALERAGGRILAAVEDLGHLAGGEAEDVAQDQDAALPGGRVCKAAMKASEMASAASSGLGARCGVGEPFQQHVGLGLQPDTPPILLGLGRSTQAAASSSEAVCEKTAAP